MGIYRVTFLTEVLVDCEGEKEAEVIGFNHLVDEVENRGSEVFSVKLLESPEQVRRWERGSLPWRSGGRRGEPEVCVEELLRRRG